MGFLDLPGLQYFYNKYIKGLKSHAFRDPANNLTTTASGYALDARQGKALKDQLDAQNSALTEHRAYCFDSGWTSYFALSVPTGTNAVVFLDTAIYRVESMADQMNVNKIATGSADNSTVVRYLEERYVAFRQNDSQGTIRAIVLTSFADVAPRW